MNASLFYHLAAPLLLLALAPVAAGQGTAVEDVVPDPLQPFALKKIELQVPVDVQIEGGIDIGNIQINVGQMQLQGIVQGDARLNFVIGGQQAVQPDPPSHEPDFAGPHLLEFTDGAQLHGTLLDFGREEVKWSRADAAQEMLFAQREVTRVYISSTKQDAALEPQATLMLRNGDWFVGDVFNFRDGKLEFRLPSESKLAFGEEAVDWIYLAGNTPPDSYTGPESLEGWFLQGAWELREGAITNKGFGGSFQRSFANLPDQLDFQFEADAGDVAPNFMVSLHSPDSSGVSPGNSWSQIRFSGRTLNFWSYHDNSATSENLELPDSDEVRKNKHLYRILEDRTGGRVLVYIDGKKVATWKTQKVKPGLGGGNFVFQPNRWSSDSRWKFSKIKLAPWDGREPNAEGETSPGGMDVIMVEGRGALLGKLMSILGGVVKFKHAKGEESFPRAKVSLIRLHRPAAVEAPAPPPEPEGASAGGVHVELAHRGRVLATKLNLNQDQVILDTKFAFGLLLRREEIRSLTPLPRATEPKFFRKDKTTQTKVDRLVFQNGDELPGIFTAAGGDQKLSFKLPYKEQALEFDPKATAGVMLAGGEGSKAADEVRAVTRFRNGDWIAGQLQSIDKEVIVFKTGFSESLSLTERQIESIYLGDDGPPEVWDGARDQRGWLSGQRAAGNQGEQEAFGKTGPRRWLYLDGAYSMMLPRTNGWYGNGPGIGRILKVMPDKMELRFDVSTEGENPNVNVQLFYSKEQGGLTFQIYEGGLYVTDMTPRKRGKGMVIGGQGQQFEFGEKVPSAKRHSYRFLCDRKTRRVHCYVDGVAVGIAGRGAKADDPELGTGISMTLQSYNGQWSTFSNIWMSPWTGRLPESAAPAATEPAKVETPPAANAPAPKPIPDAIAFRNGDEALCEIESADAQSLRVRFEGELLELDRRRTMLIEFGGKAETEFSTGARLRLVSGGSITVESWHTAEGKLHCKSSTMGEQIIPLSEISEIVLRRLAPKAAVATSESSAPGSVRIQRRIILR